MKYQYFLYIDLSAYEILHAGNGIDVSNDPAITKGTRAKRQNRIAEIVESRGGTCAMLIKTLGPGQQITVIDEYLNEVKALGWMARKHIQ